MTAQKIERTQVLLSLQRAMLGEVFPALRAVTVEWSDTSVKFWAYIDGPLTEEDADSLSCMSAEIAGDFWPGVEIDYEPVRLDFPDKIMDMRARVFHRREAPTRTDEQREPRLDRR
jgi:hypothetical protein